MRLQSCVKLWYSTKPVCPNHCSTHDIYAHTAHSRDTRAAKRKVPHPMQRVYLSLRDEGEHDSQHPSSSAAGAPPDIPEVRARMRARLSQSGAGGQPAAIVNLGSEEEDSEPEEEPRPVAGPSTVRPGNGLLDMMRREKAAMRASLRAAQADRDALRAQLAQATADLLEVPELRAALETARHAEEALRQALHAAGEECDRLAGGMPLEELADAQEKLEKARVECGALRIEVGELGAAANEVDSEWRTKQIAWEEERARMLAAIRTNGNSGAKKIKQLKEELDAERGLVLESVPPPSSPVPRFSKGTRQLLTPKLFLQTSREGRPARARAHKSPQLPPRVLRLRAGHPPRADQDGRARERRGREARQGPEGQA